MASAHQTVIKVQEAEGERWSDGGGTGGGKMEVVHVAEEKEREEGWKRWTRRDGGGIVDGDTEIE